jgi:hypothetical protein
VLTRAQQLFSTPLTQCEPEQPTFPDAVSNRESRQSSFAIQAPLERKDTQRCGVHGSPMAWQKGRAGYFWSCHEKLPDGSWCSYRPHPR